MENTFFTYTGHTTGSSLNKMVTEPAVIQQLKSFCTKNKCHPRLISSAVYDFVKDPRTGYAKTFYQVEIECGAGKAPESMAVWQKNNPFIWSFGVPSEEYRDI